MTENSKCDVHGCYSKIYKEGLCRSHHMLKMQYGSELMKAILAVREDIKKETRRKQEEFKNESM